MLNTVKRLLGIDTDVFDTLHERITRDRFSLRREMENEDSKNLEDSKVPDREDSDTIDTIRTRRKQATPKPSGKNEGNKDEKQTQKKKPVKLENWAKQQQEKEKQSQKAPENLKTLTNDLATNRSYIEKSFGLPTNKDIVIRDFVIATEPTKKALVVYLEGLSDKTVINDTILKSLMQLTAMRQTSVDGNLFSLVKDSLVPGNQVMEYDKWDDVISNILMGATALLLEGSEKALIIESKGWQQRSVGPPISEQVIRGPHDGFTENLRTNTALIRLRLQTNALITEMLKVGKRSNTIIAMMYINGIAHPALINHVKKRIKGLDTDVILDSGMIEQLIEDETSAFVPTVLSTERPDRVSSYLAEGHVAIIVNNSPYVLIVPVTFWAMLQTAEDAYLRWPFGTFLRYIRMISLFIAMLLPGIYIAVTNYHVEMIPTELMIAIAASREYVPFPVVFEVLLMEFAIELIREAGVRIPSIIGPTIGIVGALILGQAAVQAGIISPLLVIVVAVTALASFSIPNYNLSIGIRVSRFFFILGGAVYGFFGITLVAMVILSHVACIKSFGVPLLAPLSPYSRSKDIINRSQLFRMESRPPYMAPRNDQRQSDLQRDWNFQAHVTEHQQNPDDQRGDRDDS